MVSLVENIDCMEAMKAFPDKYFDLKAGNIDFYGYELDKDYYEAQEKRWKEYKAQLNLFRA